MLALVTSDLDDKLRGNEKVFLPLPLYFYLSEYT